MRNRISFSVIILLSWTAIAGADEPRWQPLIKGEGLNGWVQRGGEARYENRDGVIVGIYTCNTPNSFLCTEEEFGDFILEYEMKLPEGMNSGVQIRSQSLLEYRSGRVHGYQVEGDSSERAWSGGIYDEGRRGWLYPLAENPAGRKAFKVGQWNRFRVEAIGPHIRTFINDVPCADLLDDMTAKGFIGLQVHGIGGNKQHEGLEVCWRNLRICTQNPEKYVRPMNHTIAQVNRLANRLSEREEHEGWQLLWDGKTMNGWHALGDGSPPEKNWKIENGELIVTGGGPALVTDKRFRNFELKLYFKLSKGANSGIKYFIDPARTNNYPVGCEYQLLDDRHHADAKLGKDGNRRLGALYDLIPAEHPFTKRIDWDGWNQAVIRVEGDHVEHWLNNMCVVSYDRRNDEWHKLIAASKYRGYEGFGDFPDGHILLQDHGDVVHFRSIKIRELPFAPTGKWVSLFNGENLDHWTVKITGHKAGDNYKDTFRAEAGVIKVSYDQYETFDDKFGNIFYDAPFSHYKLRLEYRFLGEQVSGSPAWAFRNSGIMIHSQSPQSMGLNDRFPASIEVQLLGGDGEHVRSTGNLCTPGTHVVINGKLEKKHCINSTSPTYHGDQWVKCMVEAHGNKVIRHYINDELVMEYNQPQLDEKTAANRNINSDEDKLLHGGFIALQAESHPVEFRNIEILVLDDN